MPVMLEMVVSMEARLAVAAFELVDDGTANVSQVCRRLGISRDTFYRYRRRFEASGWPGLLPVSSRPHASPGKTAASVEELILTERHRLLAQGWDGGARSIHARLTRVGVTDLPSPRTVHRVLVRAGVVQAQPAKRPRASFRRFEHDRPNGCWQIDGTGWHLAQGTAACIVRIIDDHSRKIMATVAGHAETTVNAWRCMETAMAHHGRPAMLLSDGGSAFTGRRRRVEISEFEARLRVLGINPVVSSPYHPQTCGKKERDWQPLKQWLAAQPAAATIAELQRLLDAYDVLFNTERPHQGIGGQTPQERYDATDKALPAPGALPTPTTVHERTAYTLGRIELGNGYYHLLGKPWTGATVTVIRDDLDVVILHNQTIIKRLRIDPTRRGQPNQQHPRQPKRAPSETS